MWSCWCENLGFKFGSANYANNGVNCNARPRCERNADPGAA